MNNKDNLREKVLLPDLTGKTILIAEDDTTNFQLLDTILKKVNANIIWTKNGRETVEYIKENNVDLILMDIKMPLMNGIDATEFIRKLRPAIPVVAQTAFAFDHEMKGIRKVGIKEVLIKPIQITELARVMRIYFE